MFGLRELAPVVLSVCLFHILNGKVNASEKEPVKVTVMEGNYAILPCFLSTKEDIEFKLFDWQTVDKKEVFMYDGGVYYDNGLSGQNKQFKGRVSHFPDQLKNGNASIKIKNTKVADSGNYTCDFPRLQPRKIFHIELVVIAGAAPKPYVTILDQTNDWSLLQCEVRGASPKPEVEWKDSSGNPVPAKDPQVTESGDKYDVVLNVTVTKTDRYRCEATQEEINHQIDSPIFVHINEKPEIIIQEVSTGWKTSTVVLGILLLLVSVVEVVLFFKGIIKVSPIKGRSRHENGYDKPPVADNEQGNGLRLYPLLPGSDVPEETSSV